MIATVHVQQTSIPYQLTEANKATELEKAFLLIRDLNEEYDMEKLKISYVPRFIILNHEELLDVTTPAQLEKYIINEDS